ncbi:hypothetical protein F5Y09DRAFT_350060 [Xylaria sp. FL1042]|nr:hypothetical protein F5Y09DRAFT_350060 [Xylaria sp. FL1042]
MSPPRFQSEVADASPLAEPLQFHFCGNTANNRFLKSAITERMATWHPTNLEKRGVPTKELVNVYKRWGEGGFGIMITGNIMIEPDHLEAQGNLIIPRSASFSGDRFEAYQTLALASRQSGTLFLAQLSHPGRQTYSCQRYPARGGIPRRYLGKPQAMEQEDIDRVIEGFAHAAEYSYKAGFDGVQLHAAHGYLLAQFLAHTTNKRTDAYGGSLANRARLIFEISNAIRSRVPKKFMLGIKLNSVEFQEGGFSTEECRALCGDLEKHGFDFIELSGGTYQAIAFQHRPDVRESTKKREAFFLEFADMIVPGVKKTRVYITGGLRTVYGMVQALKTVDGVGIARPVCHEFDLPGKMLTGEAQGGLAYLLDERDYMLTDVAAGTQVRLVGDDKSPLDMTQEKHIDIFNKSMETWIGKLMADKDGSGSGWVKIESSEVELQPYGTA